MATKKHTAEEIAKVKAELIRWIPKGATVYTILRHVSRS